MRGLQIVDRGTYSSLYTVLQRMYGCSRTHRMQWATSSFSAFFVGTFAFALAAERASFMASFRQSCEAADKKARNDDEKHEKQAPPQEKEPHLISQTL